MSTKQEIKPSPISPPKETIPIAEEPKLQAPTKEEAREEGKGQEGTKPQALAKEETGEEKRRQEEAREKPQTKPQTKPETPPAKSTGTQDPLVAYYSQVRAIIERNKKYPEEAKRRGEEGTLVVRLRIGADGKIESIRIVKSSQSRYLDEGTIRMLRSLAKLPPPPKAPLELEVEIDYRLGG